MTPPLDQGRFSSRPNPLVNLRAKVTLIFLILALLPLIIIGRFSLKTTEELIGRMVIRQLENAAVDKVTLLERWLAERKADLAVVAGTALLKSMDPAKMGPYLELIRENYGVYKDLTVVSAAGDIVFSSRSQALAGHPVRSRTYPVRSALYLSGITYEPRAGESSFHIAAPVFGDQGTLAGTIYGRVGTNKISASLLKISLGATGECYLVNDRGQFLTHKDPHRILVQNISQSGSFKNIFQKRDSQRAYLDYRGIEVLGTSLNVAGTDWYLVVEQDRKEAFQSMKTLKAIIFLTIMLCIACALTLTWMLSYHIVNPIRSLSRYAGMIANSDFDKAVFKNNRRDEIGMLYHAFADMSRKLRRRHHHLEEKVDRREAKLKETDSTLRKMKRIAERSEKFAAMGRMGAAVAHEIRTPVTSLKLFLESAGDQVGQSPEDREDFQIAMQQIDRIETTINRFLDFTKPRDLVIAPIDVPALIDDVLTMIRPLVNRQECTLESRFAANLPMISGDRKLLSEALVNLMVNALEAMQSGGALTVTAHADHLELDDGDVTCIRIDIADTGQGIADHQIDNIFEPFYTTKASGTGLGLPLVLNTIRNHGGAIRVKGRPGDGTRFSLFLPLQANPSLYTDYGKNTDNR